MATFGVNPTGFSRPSVQDLLALIEADQRAEISATLDLSSDSLLGQNNGIFARHLGVAWEALEAIHDGGDPDRAEEDLLTSLAKITGSDREGASKSLLVGVDGAAAVTLESGTVLQAGVHFAHVTGKPDVRFTPRADFTAPSTGTHRVDFESENTGPVQAPANTLTVIATPVVGWSAVNNPQDPDLGTAADDDADLRIRREAALQRSGSSSVDAIRADVLAVEGVSSCQVFENFTDVTDASGLPPKSFQVVIFDSGADDDAIAQAIWQSKAGGIQSIGAESGTASDANGDPQVMHFSRATQVDVWIQANVTPKADYVGDTDFKITLATVLDSKMGTGDDVSTWDVSDAAHDLGAKVTQIKIGIAASPTLDVDVPIGTTEIARFDSSRITLITT